MINLNELKKISDDKVVQDKQREIEDKKKRKQKFDHDYHFMVDNLEHRLRESARKGERRFSVGIFSIFGGGDFANITEELSKRIKPNLSVAFGDTITNSDIVFNMRGNFKRVFDYCRVQGLDPNVKYWTDGGGEDEGFEIIIEW